MNRSKMICNQYILVALLPAAILIAGCAADPDLGEAPGTCTLDCTTAKIASSEMRFRTLNDDEEEVEIDCQDIAANEPYIGPVPIRFTVEKKERTFPASRIPDAETGEPPLGKFDNNIGAPVPNISFEVLVLTGWTADEENPEDERYKYKGIVTPKSEWCTDSCGVGAFDIVPLCKASTNTIELIVHSGPLSRKLKITTKKG